jgi:hypothetical protein
VFGGASAPSRPLLAVVRAALARADAIYQKHGSILDREPQSAAELAAIYAFLDGEIANAGKPTVAAHDPHAGIPPASYEVASKALPDHVDQHARWLKGDGPVAESVARVREVVGRLPGARIDLDVLYAGKEPSATRPRGPLRARGATVELAKLMIKK